MADRYGAAHLLDHFADTSDTLCYATNENQNATYALIQQGADMGIVVGGYNSSNTSHIVELCQAAMPTYFIRNAEEILGKHILRHFLLHARQMATTDDWLPDKRPLDVALTCGASCPGCYRRWRPLPRALLLRGHAATRGRSAAHPAVP